MLIKRLVFRLAFSSMALTVGAKYGIIRDHLIPRGILAGTVIVLSGALADIIWDREEEA